ncbi:MAG: ribulose-phosphate 3-epimerase [Cytophagales bacterium]|nr:ribulose-phosphate 3-epimerase [Flammeovirgaceae bacterium]|tara:strand:- start:4834 stop:5472 length:639 start_codon:yes stop_codon:yes gene_type:complete
MIKTSISILDCDFNNLEREINKINLSNADLIHIDIMDGFFVSNNTIEKFDMGKLSKYSKKKFDVHLMVDNPEDHIEKYIKPLTEYISIHIESKGDISKSLNKIKNNNIKAGLAINPNTKISDLYQYIKLIDMVIIMSVYPGKGGQKFIENTFDRVKMLRKSSNNIDISVDGGVSSLNSYNLISNGASTLVSGSFLMKSENINDSIKNMLKDS